MADRTDEDDGEKTVIGAPLRKPTPGLSPPRPAPVPPKPSVDEKTVIGVLPEATQSRQKPEQDERTVIGGALPSIPLPPVSQPPKDDKTIVGASLPPVAPRPDPPRTQPGLAIPPRVPPQVLPQVKAPVQNAAPASLPPAGPSALNIEALSLYTPLTTANTANPLVAAGTPLLILLGRLRTESASVPTQALYDHIVQGIAAFDQSVQAMHVDQHDAQVAKYALCGTIDDIVMNVPDIDHAVWARQALVARVFKTRDAKVGFFQEAQKAIQSPAHRYNLLEFMLICLNIGFEGQYREKPGGAADLTSIRSAILETLRRARPQEGRHLSPSWVPVALKAGGRLRAVPIWALTSMALLALVAFFATLSTVLNRDGTALAETLYALHPAQTPIALERAPGPVFVAPASQFERLSDGLAEDLSAERLELSQQGDFIVIRLGNARLFESGSSVVNPSFAPLAARIASVLDGETGPLRVIGYTDSQGAFSANMQLSIERAESVADLLREGLADPLRLSVEGWGETDPIADNSSVEGRAKNRRVEIKLEREGTF